MNKEYIEERKTISEIAHKAGRSPAYTQGAGGNVSIKTDDGNMIIKASGCRLADVSPEYGLACVNINDVKNSIMGKTVSQTEFDMAISSAKIPLCGKTAKPSVETGFHSLLHKYVIHHHSVYANIISCCSEGVFFAAQLFPESRFIPFCQPGLELCLAIRESLDERPLSSRRPEIFFFANHGLAISADNADEALNTMEDVNNKIKRHFSMPDFNLDFNTDYESFPDMPGIFTLDQLLYMPDTKKRPCNNTEKEIYAAASFILDQHKNLGLSTVLIDKC